MTISPAPLRSWQRKVAVVTGAASGIGLAMARKFASEGMVVVLVDRHPERLRSAASLVGADGAADVLAVESDVTRAESVEALADQVAEAFGAVHVLCNNAGVIRPGKVWELSDEDWSGIMDVNVGGVVNGIRAFVPRMLAHGGDGHVVNTASAAGLFTAPSFSGYCVSKAAVVALTESLAAEVAQIPGSKLRVSVLCPGGIATNLFRDEVDRRPADVPLGEETARQWALRSDPDRTDQMVSEVVADHVWRALQDGRFWILPMQADMKRAARARLRGVEAALRASDVGADTPDPRGILAAYYERVDGPDPKSALDLVADDVEFCLARGELRIEGTSQDGLAAYIAERAPLSHRLIRLAGEGDVAFALGESVDGDRSLGTFIASIRTDDSGRIDRYVAAFYPDRHFDATEEGAA
jgi:NAD(P)-dependent dehydrogenase (short-subunit alcohol dehydrogenase family)